MNDQSLLELRGVSKSFGSVQALTDVDLDVRHGEVYSGGRIPYQRYRAWQLAGRTAGVVGLGAVGRAAAWRFAGVGMRVLSYDPYNPDATHNDDLEAMLHD